MTKLDLWINSELNLAPEEIEFCTEQKARAFYEKVKVLPIADYSQEGDDNMFLIGLKGAAFGDNRVLSIFLLDQKKFSRLTEVKRLMLAWVMQHPQKKKETSRNTSAKLGNHAGTVATLEVWCGYNKEKAIQSSIECIIGIDDGSESWLTKYESMRVQVYRAIKEGGQYHDLYLQTKATYENRLEEAKKGGR